jgi:hypothetical protein
MDAIIDSSCLWKSRSKYKPIPHWNQITSVRLIEQTSDANLDIWLAGLSKDANIFDSVAQ